MALDHEDPDVPTAVEPCPDEVVAGIRTLERYLARHAAFDRWCADHTRRYGRPPGEGPGGVD
jgi:hypothetical protein